jgi:hypothetical protein
MLGRTHDDSEKYTLWLTEVHTTTAESTYSNNRKYKKFNFGHCRVLMKVPKNNKIVRKVMEVRTMTLGSTHGYKGKYKNFISGSAAFM